VIAESTWPTRLDKQLRAIADEAEGGRASVIIRMANRSGPVNDFVQTAANAVGQRALSSSARDCLPLDRAPKETMTRATPRRTARVDAFALRGSLLANAEGQEAVPSTIDDLRAAAATRMQPLLADTRVQRAVRETSGEEAVGQLWAASSLAVELSVDELKALAQDVPGIAGVYPNRRLRVPPIVESVNLPEKVREARASSYGVRMIGALSAWGAHGVRGAGVKVGVLDTGVDATHPDLNGKIGGWAEFDENGAIVAGSTPYDDDRHGTHVAGTIAGGNTSGQWIGVAPEAELWCGKVLGRHGGTDKQILAGISWALEQEVDVISMSLGGLILGPEMPGTYTEAIVQCLSAGVPVVVAIGNEGSQTTGSPGNDVFALSVGATDHLDRPAGFSGGRTQIVYESEFIRPDALPLSYSKPDVSAPGVAIISSVPGGDWAAFNGTSMAAPHVAGAIALLLSGTKIRTVTKTAERAFVISDLITGSVEELGEAGPDHRYGFGRIDILKAIDFAREHGY
jgi:subtilisin family serine protease